MANISPTLREALDAYIEENFIPQENLPSEHAEHDHESPSNGIVKGDATEPSAGQHSSETRHSLDMLIRQIGASFHETLFRQIDRSGLTDVDVYKRAHIDRRFFSKLKNNPACHPKKKTVLAFAIALKLNLEDTIDLLQRAGYAFSPSEKRDIIVKFCIENEIYPIQKINGILYEYGEAVLGS